MDDRQFVNQFSAVLLVLLGITVIIFIIARVIATQPEEQDLAMKHIVEERLKPIGKVNVGSVPDKPAAAPAAGTAPTQQVAGKQPDAGQVYQTTCAVCHATGVANAPVYGDKAAWAPRLADIETLYKVAIHGKGAMPAKGGRPDLSDDTIKAVVDHMVEAVR